jgi:hypothetical protein
MGSLAEIAAFRTGLITPQPVSGVPDLDQSGRPKSVGSSTRHGLSECRRIDGR